MLMEDFKTVATFSEKVQAEIVAAMLRDNGIPAGVFGADSSYPSLGYAHPIEVKVNAQDFQTALELLKEMEK